MSNSKDKNLKQYGLDADELARSYNAVSTADIVPDFADYVLKMSGRSGKWALDIGCGSGRDAHWLATQGFNVVAVDGVGEMIHNAMSSKAHDNIHYVHDAAPEMEKLRALNQKFDVILMNAFLFHLDRDERQVFYQHIVELAQPQAFLYMNVRHGPVPAGRKDVSWDNIALHFPR
jgi:2-polyprenyl-3-methyl-5-hydroxy-6-metoxy-1,4-benzoquinol methylase